MWASGKDPASIVKEKGLVQVSDPSAIQAAVRKVMESSPKNVEEYRAGKEKLFGFFIGQTMKETGGKANPALLNEIVKAMLKGDK
jgi:aspartyl-tRNA(Asn)/glutamyl-tRNA(Gln) amidotransferase subunit B